MRSILHLGHGSHQNHLISPDCPRLGLTVHNCYLKTPFSHSFQLLPEFRYSLLTQIATCMLPRCRRIVTCRCMCYRAVRVSGCGPGCGSCRTADVCDECEPTHVRNPNMLSHCVGECDIVLHIYIFICPFFWTRDLGVWSSIPSVSVICKSHGQALNPHCLCPPSSNGTWWNVNW